jgi:phosphoglycerol transferase MdoB-like AlkP superfamily enzyme
LVVVQSESFFDVRRLYPGIDPGLLRHFDRLCDQASAHGPLRVPAWGANTMRTEFAFLSGLDETLLGVHRFNPFRRFAHNPWQTLPKALSDAGYRTIAVHPHPASFFSRDRVYPQLGFHEFIDIAAFPGAERFGPYVSDAAVANKLHELLVAAKQPTLLFAITMENHGPLHLEKVASGDIDRLYSEPPPSGFDDLTIYLRHLANADRMLGNLAEVCRTSGRDTVLCFYGDHVPSMPHVYAEQDFHDGRSDYLIWRPTGIPGERLELTADQLAARLLRAAGLSPMPDPGTLRE